MSEPVGIIHPPSELREIIDRTAKYVAKNGGAFEERIIREKRNTPRFSFLYADDPFNAYYKHKVRELRNATLAEEEESRRIAEENSAAANKEVQSQREDVQSNNTNGNRDIQREKDNHSETSRGGELERNESGGEQRHEESGDRNRSDENERHDDPGPGVKPKLGEYMQEISKKEEELEEPPQLTFLAAPASFITHLESDIIKLTAQYIASYGRDFLLELVSREQGNPHFDFLKPQHGQFPYMTQLIMQYALIQNSPLDILERLKEDSTKPKHILKKFEMRAKWNKMLELERLKREEAEEKEKTLYSQIDWHDFVIVEQIDYQYNEVGEYPPTRPDQVGTRLLRQQRKDDINAPEEMEIDMDVESDEEDDGTTGEGEIKANDGFVVPNPPDASNVIIRKDYDPKLAPKVVSQPEIHYVSPITNERITVDKFEEHMRYNLADPRYLDKKQQMLQDKINEDSVYASGSQVNENLKSFSERRTDIFGMNDNEAAIGRRIGEEEQEQSKDNKLIWDGHKSSLKKKRLN